MMKKIVAIAQILLMVFFWNVPLVNVRFANADDSDIFGNNIQPNVMIFLDNSGSMDDQVLSSPYNSTTIYNNPLTYVSAKVYQQFTKKKDCKPDPNPCYKVYAETIGAVNSSAAQGALTTTGYWTGKISGSNVDLYYGNYLNWQACASCSSTDKKINIAKRVLTNILNNVQGVRFGLMDFKYSPLGGQMVAPIGTAASSIITNLNGVSPSSSTPTGEALQDVQKYFKGLYSGYSSPIQYSCQSNFIIVISDGLWNGTVNPASIATGLFAQDHSSTYSGTQNVIVNAIGFGLDSSDPGIASLQQTAKNGGGTYYTANTEVDLERSLQAAISQIITASFSFANPVVPTTGTSGSTRGYFASFQSDPVRPFWRGYLKAYTRDANGLIQVDTNGIPLDSALAWDAGQQLSTLAPNGRTIYTAVSGTMQSFNLTNAVITNSLLGASSNSQHDQILNFTLGIDAYDENGNGDTTEQRAWKLGDIFHSTPVLITPPFLPSSDLSYNTFKTNNASRTKILLAGANDGMMHAFRESDGTELWAFIPPDQLDNLQDLTSATGTHDFFVDGSPIAADIKTGSVWKTIVIFGERRGGKTYYALDITDTTNPQYLWSFTDSKMGEGWSEPAIGKVKVAGGTDKYVAFIGGGYDTTSNNSSGKAVFAIDLATGSKLWEYYKPGTPSGDQQYMNFSIAAAPAIVDLDSDGYIDRVYIGDVGGQLWKFDVSPPATLVGGMVSNWTARRFFAAAASQSNPPPVGEYYPTQAIYAPPAVAYDTSGAVWIYFGTGDRNHPNSSSSNRFYGMKDDGSMSNGSALTESSLTNVTSGSGAITVGWYIQLNNNEKILAAPTVFNGAVLFTTFTPASTAACGNGGGAAQLYAVNSTTGDAALDLSGGTTAAAGQSALSLAKAIGTGIPSRPEIIITESAKTGSPYVITGTTNRQITNTAVPAVLTKKIFAWREVF
jgi:type IV pilus assembly protein PilY1